MRTGFLTLPTAIAALLGTTVGAIPSPQSLSDGPSSGNLGGSVNGTRANFSFDQLWQLQTRFWDNFVNNNTAQAASINSTLLAPDILGRVDVTRTFDGQELNTEYLFGLFANLKTSQAATLLGVPTSYKIVHFAANQDITASATVVTFKNQILGEFPLEIDSYVTWNTEGQMWQYDATFRWFANLLDATLEAAQPLVNASSPAGVVAYFTDALAKGICNTSQTYCNGTNQQYDSFDACYKYLTQDVRFGASYELGANTLLCRMVHENMVPLRPSVHCPHIGPSGGGMCVDDTTYSARVLQPYFTHAPMVPYGYEDRNATVAAW